MRYSGLHPRDIYGAADTQKNQQHVSNPPTNLVHLTVDAWAHGRSNLSMVCGIDPPSFIFP
jgi:hypothetical protein